MARWCRPRASALAPATSTDGCHMAARPATAMLSSPSLLSLSPCRSSTLMEHAIDSAAILRSGCSCSATPTGALRFGLASNTPSIQLAQRSLWTRFRPGRHQVCRLACARRQQRWATRPMTRSIFSTSRPRRHHAASKSSSHLSLDMSMASSLSLTPV